MGRPQAGPRPVGEARCGRTVAGCLLALLIGGIALAAHAQMGPRLPRLQGVWNPVVGTGGAYRIDGSEGYQGDIQIAIVAQEAVDGKDGYWLEMSMADPRSKQPILAKQLMVRDGDTAEVRRMIIALPGQEPIELPIATMHQSPRGEQPADVRKQADRIGVEDITTPAGTFTCEHYQLRDGGGDVWVSDKVAPWGLVKMTGRTNMILVREVTGATSQITGTPKPFDASQMLRRMRDQGTR